MPNKSRLTATPTEGMHLLVGEKLVSPNENYTLIMQVDGNLALYPTEYIGVAERTIWKSDTAGKIDKYFTTLQSNGNLVICSGVPIPTSAGNKVIKSIDTAGEHANYFLNVQNDGNLVIYKGIAGQGNPSWTWSSKAGKRLPETRRAETHDDCIELLNSDEKIVFKKSFSKVKWQILYRKITASLRQVFKIFRR